MSDNKTHGSDPDRPDYTLQSIAEAARTNVGGHGGFHIRPDELLKPCTYPNERAFYEASIASLAAPFVSFSLRCRGRQCVVSC